MKIAELFAAVSVKPDKRSFSAANRLLGAVKTALIGIVAFKTVKFFSGLITDTAKAADQFAKMSKQIGISVEGLQQLEFAAKISGTDLGVLRTGLQRFARTVDDANEGLGEAVDSIKRLGLQVTDTEGNLRPVDELLEDVADKFASMEDGTEKTALAMRVFGRAGAQLIPLLNEGKEGIDALRTEFVELGAQIDGETAAAFEQLNDDQLRVKTALTGLRNQAVIALLPVLKDLVQGMLAWVKANKELLKQRLKRIFQGLIFVLKTFGRVVGFIIDNWKALVIVLTSVVAAKAILRIITAMKLLQVASVRAALASAAAWIVAMAPFILIALGIIALILIAEDLYRAFTDGKSVFKEFGQFIWKHVVAAFNAVTDAVARAIAAVVDFAKRAKAVFTGPVLDVVQAELKRRQEAAGVTRPLPAIPRGGNITTVSNDITVNPSAGMDEAALAQKVANTVSEKLTTQSRGLVASTSGAGGAF